MGKESLIKSTTKKEPAAKKEVKPEQAKTAAPKMQTPAKPKSDAQPKKKTTTTKAAVTKKPPVKAGAAKPKKSPVKAKATTAKKAPVKKKPPAKPKASTTAKKKPAAKSAPRAAMKKEAQKAVKQEIHTPEIPPPDAQLPPVEKQPADPANRMMLFGLAGFVFLVLLVIVASWMNTSNFYIKSGQGAIDIWQGKFAPKGAKLLMSVPGVPLPEPAKDKYIKADVFPLIYQYYLDKADMLLEVPGMPDFEGVKSYLNKSQSYATSSEMKNVIKGRLNAISLMVLLYKAEVAGSKDSVEDLETARDLFKKALSYPMDEIESTRIKRKADTVSKRLDKLKAAAKEEKSTKDK
jgi:colicin import membrane protein